MYDIVFISYNELNADNNFAQLKNRFPLAKRVHGIKGIHNAHVAAAKKSMTKMFWVVDGDAVILDSFNFVYDNAYKEIDTDTVYVYRSRNPINNLSYGYGGVKLLPKHLTLKIDLSSTDMTTSISNKFVPLPEVSNITEFNTDPFSTWRSAFRECVKLASNSIDRQKNSETRQRLDAWCKLNENVPYGAYAYLGATSGKIYGEKNASNQEALSRINDFTWLEAQWLAEKSQLSLEHTQ
jgi:hypothetical protein